MAWANTSAAVAWSSLRSRSAGPVASNPRVHQSWPRVRTSVSSTSHPGSPPGPGARAAIGPLASENRLMLRFLRTGLQPAASPLSWLSGRKAKRHFCQDSMRPRARPATSRIPGLPRYTFTSSAWPPRIFTDSPRNCGSNR